jgi:hypothetical protein
LATIILAFFPNIFSISYFSSSVVACQTTSLYNPISFDKLINTCFFNFFSFNAPGENSPLGASTICLLGIFLFSLVK